MKQIEQVNQLQQDAEQAKIEAATGDASLEQVITATETADTAFRMLRRRQQARRCLRRGEEHPRLSLDPPRSGSDGERRQGRFRLSG